MSQFHMKLSERRRRRQIVITVSLVIACWVVASFAVAQETDAQGIEPDCQCRAPDGQMRDLGTVECFDIVGHEKLVRCEMSTNTPYWKQLDGIEGCPTA